MQPSSNGAKRGPVAAKPQAASQLALHTAQYDRKTFDSFSPAPHAVENLSTHIPGNKETQPLANPTLSLANQPP